MTFEQSWPRPSSPLPIVIIGAGGIVVDSHMPAYSKAGFEIKGIWNRNKDRAQAVAARFDIPRVYDTLEQAAAEEGVVFDIASSHQVHVDMIEALRDRVPVLIQKPMGADLAVATSIIETCRRKKLDAAVNFQLRFSPMMLAVRDALAKGFFGTLTEIEVHLNILTPWDMFPNLVGDPRVEMVSHSVHYIDLIQSLVGVPQGAFARSYSFPGSKLTDTRTSAILDYGSDLRCTFSINHHHNFGPSHQTATIRFEGSAGAAVCKLGVLMDYPKGEPDELWMGKRGERLEKVDLQGFWFPDAFGYVMNNMQRYVAGEDRTLHSSVESAWRTMAIVEACYGSADLPMHPIQQLS